MKKPIISTLAFTFALLLSTGMALGQSNMAKIDQSGSGNGATINQDGSGNFAWTIQKGRDGTAIIKQVGNNNEAQDNPSNAPPGSQAGISDMGNRNYAYMQQIGNEQDANIRFGATGNSHDNTVKLYQGKLSNHATSARAAIHVAGSYNTVNAHQYGYNDITHIDIKPKSYNNNVYLLQKGNRASAVKFSIDGDQNLIKAYQLGHRNHAEIHLKDDADWNVVTILQHGSSSSAAVNISGGSNTATITQYN